MGLYDEVDAPSIPCKLCGNTVSGWQTKDLGCDLETVPITHLNRFYSSCSKCGAWHEYIRDIPPAMSIDDFKLHVIKRTQAEPK